MPAVDFTIETTARSQLVDVTDRVEASLAELGVRDGAVLVASPHTTAAITINEGHDPDVARDLVMALDRIVPSGPYRHAEGNSDSHAKVALLGASQLVPVRDGGLGLGQWQRIFLGEFDGPRSRTVEVHRL